MDTQIHLILIAVAFVLALSRIAFSYVKRKDKENGLYIPDRYYTLIGTARLMFLSEEKRLMKEKEKPFEDLVKENKDLKKKVLILVGAYSALSVIASLILYAQYGLITTIFANASMIVMAISYLLSKNRILAIFLMIYGTITGGLAILAVHPVQLIMTAAGIGFFVYDMILRKEASGPGAEKQMHQKE